MVLGGAAVVEVWAYHRWPQVVVALVELAVAMDGWLVVAVVEDGWLVPRLLMAAS